VGPVPISADVVRLAPRDGRDLTRPSVTCSHGRTDQAFDLDFGFTRFARRDVAEG
jgi:hypothetical protein